MVEREERTRINAKKKLIIIVNNNERKRKNKANIRGKTKINVIIPHTFQTITIINSRIVLSSSEIYGYWPLYCLFVAWKPMAGGGNFFQVVVQVTSIVCCLLRVAVLHDQDAPAVASGRQQGPHCHGRLWKVCEQTGGCCVSSAQVATASSSTEWQLGYVGGAGVWGGATVVIVDAARGGTAKGVVVLKVFRQVD